MFNLSILFSVTFEIPIGVQWVKVNAGQNGYYRVLYDEANWEDLVRELKTNHERFSATVSFYCICIITNNNPNLKLIFK